MTDGISSSPLMNKVLTEQRSQWSIKGQVQRAMPASLVAHRPPGVPLQQESHPSLTWSLLTDPGHHHILFHQKPLVTRAQFRAEVTKGEVR